LSSSPGSRSPERHQSARPEITVAGAAHDEPGVYVTLQENRIQIARVIGRFGWSIDNPNVVIMDRSPVDLYVDELVYELLETEYTPWGYG